MKNVAIVGCGAYMDQSCACPGDWKCYKAAARGEGKFDEQSHIIAFVKCECPGRAIVTNVGMALKASEMKPDAIYLSSCLVKPKPGCPYMTPEELAKTLEAKTGVRVVLETHNY